MPAAVRFDPETGIWTFELSGVVEPKEVLDAYEEMRARPDFDPRAPRLWDARATDASQIIDGIALRRLSQESGSGVPHRVAIVVARDVDYGMSRMFEAYAEGDRQMASTHVFRDYDEAVRWLVSGVVEPTS